MNIKRFKCEKIVDAARKYFGKYIDYFITLAFIFRVSYIGHNFYSRVGIKKEA